MRSAVVRLPGGGGSVRAPVNREGIGLDRRMGVMGRKNYGYAAGLMPPLMFGTDGERGI